MSEEHFFRCSWCLCPTKCGELEIIDESAPDPELEWRDAEA